jgi:hypothetical protein
MHSGKSQKRDFIMQENATEFSTVEVYSDKKDMARWIMEETRKRRRSIGDSLEKLQLNAYYITSLVAERVDTSVGAHKDTTGARVARKDRRIIKVQDYLCETQSEVFIDKQQVHERVIGFRDINDDEPSDADYPSITMEIGEKRVAPTQFTYVNPYVVQTKKAFTEFNIDAPLQDWPYVCEKKITSPLSSLAYLQYRFVLDRSFTENGKHYWRVAFSPIFRQEALFEGFLDIADTTFDLVHASLHVNKAALFYCRSFDVELYYEPVNGIWPYPTRKELRYTISESGKPITGKVDIQYTDVSASNHGFRFSQEIRAFDQNAFDHDSSYWAGQRKFALDSLALAHMHRCDSLQRYYSSERYKKESDSTYNHLKFMDFILRGVHYRSRVNGYSLIINPLVLQVNPVGIGGYRHRFGGKVQFDLPKAYTLETEGFADYGFRNKDVRGSLGVGLTYVPLRFVRTFVRFGDTYDMINTYASIGSIFSRSNYVRSRSMSIAQRMELFNGFFAELTFLYSDQQPINNLQQDKWSERVFKGVNAPVSFERYIKSEIRLDIQYTINQPYTIKKGRKLIHKSNYPEITAVYRKGLPGLFGSEVNFDYLEVGAHQSAELGRFGQMDWSVLGGSFVNSNNLRLLEHRYFRGSDALFFSDPLRSFQLLGPTLNTRNAYFRANYFQHFNGILLNKIPLLSRLKLTEAAGAGTLIIPSSGFRHAEVYAGLERVFRIRRELFRFGIYAVTADSNLGQARFQIKFGVNFYNSYTRSWSF